MKNITVFVSENFKFLEEKFSIYLNRHVFVMIYESIDCMPDLKRLLTLVTSDGPFHLHVLHTLIQTSSFVNETNPI